MRAARLLLGWLILLNVAGTTALSDDFRVETKVYAAKGKAAVSQNVTLFQSGRVYDYLSDPPRVAVFDQARGRFVILDPVRKLKAEVKTDEVQEFADRFHAVASKSSNPFTKFTAEPDFEVAFSEDGALELTSKHMTYALETMPANSPEAAEQYREFCDWYARFNVMSNPGSTPPFARMAVNAELADRGLVPAEVQLTIPAHGSVKPVTLRSEHNFQWRLLEKDAERIAKTAQDLATFKTVDFDQFEPTTLTKRDGKKTR